MGCCNKTQGKTPKVRIGTDTIFSVVLFRRNGSIGMSQAPEEKDVIDPRMLASIEAEIRNEFGDSEAVVTNIDGKLLKLEVTKELTQRMGLGRYRLGLKIREEDVRFTDGYRDITLVSELCQVVSDGAEAGQANTEISVAIAQLATGKSAYQLYLETTTDTPKKTLPEWLASLKGDKGGDAYDVYISTTTDNPKKSRAEWLQSLKGAKGDDGYQSYLDTTTDNPKKSRKEWLDSLKGKDGKSAYQSYLDTTSDEPKMSEQEWATGGWLVFAELLKRI